LSAKLSGVILATTKLKDDDPLEAIARSMDMGVFRGSENDVLERYVKAAELANVDVIVRITADCPLIDPEIIDQVIEDYLQSPADYVFITGYPNGLGAAEVLTVSALQQAYEETESNETYYREHVMPYITDNPMKFSLRIKQAPVELNRPMCNLYVDVKSELDVVRRIYEHFYPRMNFSTREIIAFLDENPEVLSLNTSVKKRG